MTREKSGSNSIPGCWENDTHDKFYSPTAYWHELPQQRAGSCRLYRLAKAPSGKSPVELKWRLGFAQTQLASAIQEDCWWDIWRSVASDPMKQGPPYSHDMVHRNSAFNLRRYLEILPENHQRGTSHFNWDATKSPGLKHCALTSIGKIDR